VRQITAGGQARSGWQCAAFDLCLDVAYKLAVNGFFTIAIQ